VYGRAALRFNHPAGVVREYPRWAVLLRPAQVTLGSLVLVSTSEVTAFGALAAPDLLDLGTVVADLERTLGAVFGYDRINYLMIMINDPNPHFHVIPRYASARSFAGREFLDTGWPKPPDLDDRLELDPTEWEALRRLLAGSWRGEPATP
jgi:diadenosine tetraphosphate (Ap4A) HIT family hydrolase